MASGARAGRSGRQRTDAEIQKGLDKLRADRAKRTNDRIIKQYLATPTSWE